MPRLSQLLTLAEERAQSLGLPYTGALTPKEAAEVLLLAPQARLVDVRTRAELDWVGRIPRAIEIEWLSYPDRVRNERFTVQLKHAVDQETMLLFLCRSGRLSDLAARSATEAGFTCCYNILEGFEGEKDANGQRNKVGGWRLAGLPWSQS